MERFSIPWLTCGLRWRGARVGVLLAALFAGLVVGWSPSGGTVVAAPPPAAKTPATSEVERKLQKKTSLTFERNTLEYSVQALSDDLDVPIKLHLPSMSLEGITRNQQVTLEENDKSGLAILKAIMLKANSDGKLVYCITQDAAGENVVMICTRAGAAQNKWAIPADMRLPKK